MIEFEIKSINDFWDWLNRLPQNCSHPRHSTRINRLLVFDRDRRHVCSPQNGVFIFHGTKDIPLICLAKIQHPPNCCDVPDDLLFNYIVVDPAFRHQGLGLALVRQCFQYAADRKMTLQFSSHSEEGAAYLLPHYSKLVEETGVSIRFGDCDLRYRSKIIPPAYKDRESQLTL